MTKHLRFPATLLASLLTVGFLGTGAYAEYPAASYLLGDNGTVLEAWYGSESDLDLASDPAFVNVEKISNWVFMDKAITSIVLPPNLREIGLAVFSGCQELESVTFPESLTTIGNSAFYDCRSLRSVELPEKIAAVPKGCFNGCYSLESVSLPEGVILIDEEAFKGCGMKDFVMPDAVQTIGAYAFEDADLSGSVTFAGQLTQIEASAFSGSSIESADMSVIKGAVSIGFNAFQNCENLKTVKLPETVDYVASGMFTRCVSLESISIPAGWESVPSKLCYYCSGLRDLDLGNVITIANSAFFCCESLENIVWSSQLETIDWNVFYECKSLETLELPESLVSIDDYSFSGCDALRTIHIGSGMQSLGQECFSMNPLLEKVVCEAAVPPTLGSYAFYKSNVEEATLEVPEESIPLYRNASQWKDFSKIEKVSVGLGSIGEENLFSLMEGGIVASTPVDILTLNGAKVAEGVTGTVNLTPGFYIIADNEKAFKVIVK